jgi:hypothetical protein
MGSSIQHAHRYSVSIMQRNLNRFNYETVVDNVETMVNSLINASFGNYQF